MLLSYIIIVWRYHVREDAVWLEMASNLIFELLLDLITCLLRDRLFHCLDSCVILGLSAKLRSLAQESSRSEDGMSAWLKHSRLPKCLKALRYLDC